jgi:hypothetical protein
VTIKAKNAAFKSWSGLRVSALVGVVRLALNPVATASRLERHAAKSIAPLMCQLAHHRRLLCLVTPRLTANLAPEPTLHGRDISPPVHLVSGLKQHRGQLADLVTGQNQSLVSAAADMHQVAVTA